MPRALRGFSYYRSKVFNRMKLVNNDDWICYWLLEDNSVVYQDSDNNSTSFKYDSYNLAAKALIQNLIDAQMVGFKHVAS